eukprot:scaffold481_cov148-Skeletonema_menzelii.AAC.11
MIDMFDARWSWSSHLSTYLPFSIPYVPVGKEVPSLSRASGLCISNDALPPKWTGGDDEVARLEEEEEGKACILEERALRSIL